MKAVPCGATTFVIPASNKRDQIELAFANDRAIRVDQARAWSCAARKALSFRKSGVSGEFRYFAACGVGFEQAPAERDHFADVVADRKHDAAAKTIVNFAAGLFFVAQFDQAALQKLVRE